MNDTGRHVQVGHGQDVGHQPWVSHVDGRAYAGLTGIVLEAALDSSFLYGCFGFLMGQGHILTEANHHAYQGEHLCDNRMRMLILNDFRNFKHKGIRVVYQRLGF